MGCKWKRRGQLFEKRKDALTSFWKELNEQEHNTVVRDALKRWPKHPSYEGSGSSQRNGLSKKDRLKI
eukprot:scaffold373302_cov59-Attheya_sp.AAC.1